MSYKLDEIKVLVIEDNLPMMEITKALLLTFGVRDVITAKQGEEGFRAFIRHNPDLVISDWMMTPMDGISLTRLIRSSPQSPNPYVPVILMTGFSEKRRVIQARDAGVTEFLVKPFTAQDLYKRLVQIIERPRQFVKSKDFFGPDRRRKLAEDYAGPRRRNDDSTGGIERRMKQAQAAADLKTIRDSVGLKPGDAINLDRDTVIKKRSGGDDFEIDLV